jgi:hypothetical protein
MEVRFPDLHPLDDLSPLCPAGIYALYDAEDALLYLGQSQDIRGRVANHRTHQPWGPQIARVAATPIGDLAERVRIEALLILHFLPRHNKALMLNLRGGRVSEIRFPNFSRKPAKRKKK